MRNARHSRGFTLLELLVGAAVGAVVLLGISLTFISQARQYQVHASRRGLQANARQAMAFMERHLRIAGYGVSPDRAIIAYDSYDAANDAYAAGHPDAFVVHWRDELFHKRASTGLTDATLPLTTPLSEPLRKGQILLVLCARAAATDMDVDRNPPHRYVTVRGYTAKGEMNIQLDATAPGSAPNSPIGQPGRLFHEQLVPGFGSHACFSREPPHVLLIHRAAFYVAMFDDNGLRTPYLMMHKGLDMPADGLPQGDGQIDDKDGVPVAEGIEQLQVAYILDTHAADADGTPLILGVNEAMGPTRYGEAWEQIDPAPDKLPTGWFFNITYGDPSPPFSPQDMSAKRLEDHPANIRQVRLTLVSRSTVPDAQVEGDDLLLRPDSTLYPDGPALTAGPLPWRHLENLTLEALAADFKPQGGHHYRIILREAVTPKNMLLNRQFAPMTEGGG